MCWFSCTALTSFCPVPGSLRPLQCRYPRSFASLVAPGRRWLSCSQNHWGNKAKQQTSPSFEREYEFLKQHDHGIWVAKEITGKGCHISVGWLSKNCVLIWANVRFLKLISGWMFHPIPKHQLPPLSFCRADMFFAIWLWVKTLVPKVPYNRCLMDFDCPKYGIPVHACWALSYQHDTFPHALHSHPGWRAKVVSSDILSGFMFTPVTIYNIIYISNRSNIKSRNYTILYWLSLVWNHVSYHKPHMNHHLLLKYSFLMGKSPFACPLYIESTGIHPQTAPARQIVLHNNLLGRTGSRWFKYVSENCVHDITSNNIFRQKWSTHGVRDCPQTKIT